jgi:HlyD family secretion protein
MIFRKVALERLSSPEQLDQLLQVTDAKGWLALAALAALLLAGLGWGIFGTIPTEASGSSILIRSGGVSDVVPAGSGQVTEVLVHVGDEVAKGQVVAHIRQDVLQRTIDDLSAKLADKRKTYQEMLRSIDEQKRLGARDLGQQGINLDRSIAALEKNVALLSEREAAEEKLLADGLITKQTLVGTQQSLNTARDQLAAQKLDRNGLELKRLSSEQGLDQQLETRRTEIQDLEAQIREDQVNLKENANVVSPVAGHVIEITADRGDVVSPATAILAVEVESKKLVAVVFIPAAEGKQVRAGMEARISPSTAKKEEFGYMLGRVTHVAPFLSSSRGMVRLVGNEQWVTKILQEGPLVRVDVDLIEDPRTPTGYRWSSSHGPDGRLSTGTIGDGSVVVREDRPISLLLPTLREKLGV